MTKLESYLKHISAERIGKTQWPNLFVYKYLLGERLWRQNPHSLCCEDWEYMREWKNNRGWGKGGNKCIFPTGNWGIESVKKISKRSLKWNSLQYNMRNTGFRVWWRWMIIDVSHINHQPKRKPQSIFPDIIWYIIIITLLQAKLVKGIGSKHHDCVLMLWNGGASN